MSAVVVLVGVGVVVFASTNIDDMVVLSAFFADPQFRTRSVVIGQFTGIGTLVFASFVAAALAWNIPDGWLALLGLAPLALGVVKLRKLLARNMDDRDGDVKTYSAVRTHAQFLAVAAVTVANGGDNLAVYIPLFASARAMAVVYVAVFALMTALWCFLAYRLVNNRLLGGTVRRYGRIVLPFVLIALGLYILSGIRVLFG